MSLTFDYVTSSFLNLRKLSSLVFGSQCGRTFRCSAGCQLWIRFALNKDFLLCSACRRFERGLGGCLGPERFDGGTAGELEIRKKCQNWNWAFFAPGEAREDICFCFGGESRVEI